MWETRRGFSKPSGKAALSKGRLSIGRQIHSWVSRGCRGKRGLTRDCELDPGMSRCIRPMGTTFRLRPENISTSSYSISGAAAFFVAGVTVNTFYPDFLSVEQPTSLDRPFPANELRKWAPKNTRGDRGYENSFRDSPTS